MMVTQILDLRIKSFSEPPQLDCEHLEKEGVRLVEVNQSLRCEIKWRKERDSNPRNRYRFSGFQDRRIRPLCHPSGILDSNESHF